MSQSFSNLLYHIVFSTKEGQPIITHEHQPRLYEYIRGKIAEPVGSHLVLTALRTM